MNVSPTYVNCRTDPAGWRDAKASVGLLIMTSAVAECRDPCSNPMQGTTSFSLLLFAINKAYS